MADKKSVLTKKETSAKSAVAATAVAAKKTETAPVAPKKTESPDATAKKATKKAAVRKPAKKTTKKNTERVQEVYFEFDEKQIEAGQVVKKIEEAYKNEGHQIGRIKDLKVYINPSDNRAYYVINGNAEGKSVEL